MRNFSILNKLVIGMTLTVSIALTGCDDPMAAAIKAGKQAEAEKAKADAEKHKADLNAQTERDKLELEREKERNRMELEREKLRISEQQANRTTGTTTGTGSSESGTSVGERTQETVKPGDEGAALGGSDGPTAPTSATPTTTK